MPEDNNTPSKSSQDNTTEDKDAEHLQSDIPAQVAQNAKALNKELNDTRPTEHGGQQGPEPTRYGDWEKKGRCTDF